MAQNRFLTAAERLWEAVEEEKGVAIAVVIKRIFYRALDMPDNRPLTDASHPMHLYTRGSFETIRGRMREAFRRSSDNEEVRDIVDIITEAIDSRLYELMTTVISRYRNWRSAMEEENSDSD